MHIIDIHISVILRGFRGGKAFFDPFRVKIKVYTGPTINPNFFCFILFYIMSPAPPIAASLSLTALLMLYRENPAKCPSLAKNPPKYTTA